MGGPGLRTGPTPMFAGMTRVVRKARSRKPGKLSWKSGWVAARGLLRLRGLHSQGRAARLQRRSALRTAQRFRLAIR